MCASPKSDLTGTVIDGRFRLGRLLGKGGMGRVYLGTQLSVERKVAIKVVREEISDSVVVEARFFREAKIVASLRHPNIVNVIDFGRDSNIDALFIVMEYVNGLPLSALLQKGRLRLPLALHVTRQICSGLAEAHDAGIIHRDLKPDNVMLQRTAEGAVTARILDFGIALPTGEDARFTSTGAVVGTPHYMAPEQAQDHAVDGRSDLHAVGVMLFEMLTGRLPWVASTPMAVLLKVVSTPPPTFEETLPPGARPPQPVVEFVSSLLEKVPDKRPASAAEAGQWLDEIIAKLDASLESFPSLEALDEAVIAAEEFAFDATMESPASGGPAPPAPRASTTLRESTAERPDQAEVPEPRVEETTRPTATLFAAMALVLAVLAGIGWWFLAPGTDSSTEMSTETTRGTAQVEQPNDAPPSEAPFAKATAPATEKPPTEPSPPTVTPPPPKEDPSPGPKQLAQPTTKPKPAAGAQPKTGGDPIEAEPTPPVDDELLAAKILVQGGHCPDDRDCTFSPDARAAVCKSDSECHFDCANGNCLQQCQGQANCSYDCSGGKCQQFCSGESECSLSCEAGGCTQYCQDEARCSMSCGGGGCNRRRFGNSEVIAAD